MQVTLGASVYYAPANTIDINIHRRAFVDAK